MTSQELEQMQELGFTNRQWGSMLGNGTSVNVMERLFLRGLTAAGLLKKSVAKNLDRWKDPSKATFNNLIHLH